MEPQLSPFADAAGWPRARPVHGFEHGPAFRSMHGDDPRRPPNRPGPPPAHHRRRAARGFTSLTNCSVPIRAIRPAPDVGRHRSSAGIRSAQSPPGDTPVGASRRRIDVARRSCAPRNDGAAGHDAGFSFRQRHARRRSRGADGHRAYSSWSVIWTNFLIPCWAIDFSRPTAAGPLWPLEGAAGRSNPQSSHRSARL